MSDETKELLELAAKAMGYRPIDKSPFVFYVAGDRDGAVRKWNPLESADDLVEMESELEIDIAYLNNSIQATLYSSLWVREKLIDHDSKITARTMASLRVAAEIGRRME